MTRSIISKFIILLIVLFTALSIFWFFKTSALKKRFDALILSSNGVVSASSVSVAGFPLQQKLIVDDLKVQSSFSLPFGVPTPLVDNKYQVKIKKLEAIASIFSGNFVVNNIAEVSFQDQNGVINSVQFNQPPKSSFVISGGELAKFSYQDSGYKIIDAGKNVLFENGNSLISFESTAEGENKYRNRIKVDFKDIGDLSFGNDLASPVVPAAAPTAIAQATPTNNVADKTQAAQPAGAPQTPPAAQPNTNKAIVPNAPATIPGTPNAVNQPVNNNPIANSLVKKSLSFDVEYVVTQSKPAVPSVPPVAVPGVATPDQKNTSALAAAPTEVNASGSTIELLSIKSFEISSPLYKFSINGDIKSFPKDSLPIGSVSVRIEKLDNVLSYFKKSIDNFSKATTPATTANKVENVADVTNPSTVVIVSSATAIPATVAVIPNSAVPVVEQKPTIDVAGIVKDLAKRNPASNEDVAIFDFRQEQGKDLLINETPLAEIMNKIFVDVKTAAGNVVNGVIDPSAGNKVGMPSPAPIPTPAQIAIPQK